MSALLFNSPLFFLKRSNHTYNFFIFILAVNYFVFRVELFENEYDDNHPIIPDTVSFSASNLTWESFDKDNAPKAFVCNCEIQIEFIDFSPQQFHETLQFYPPFQLIQDKSPPSFF